MGQRIHATNLLVSVEDLPIGLWLSQRSLLCIGFSAATLLFELLFIVAVVIRRWLPLFVFVGLIMHVVIWQTIGALFLQLMLLYCVFVPFDRFVGTKVSQTSS